MTKQQYKRFVQIFTSCFLIVFVFANWESFSWIFNQRTFELVQDSFSSQRERDNNALVASTANISQFNDFNNKESDNFPYTSKINSIEIPKIGITAPLLMGYSIDLNTLENNLDQGAVIYPDSVLPSQAGLTTILGHSAPPNWPKIKYDWVFSNIGELSLDDEILIHFNSKKYTYRVVEKNVVQIGQEINQDKLNGENNMLALVSCWPPGKNYRRIVVQAKLVE